jgi:hypothetical protein
MNQILTYQNKKKHILLTEHYSTVWRILLYETILFIPSIYNMPVMLQMVCACPRKVSKYSKTSLKKKVDDEEHTSVFCATLVFCSRPCRILLDTTTVVITAAAIFTVNV